MVAYIQMFCRSVVILVFTISFASKLRHVATFQQTITNFALLPAQFSRLAALLFLLAEALVVVLVALAGPLLLSGYLLAAALLLVFCAALLSVLTRRISTTCSCFGPTSTPVSSLDIVRNTGFIACSPGGCFTQRFHVVLGNSPRNRLAFYYGQVMSAVMFAKEVRLFNLGDYFLRAFTKITRTIQATQRNQQQRELSWEAVCMTLSACVGGGAFIYVFVQTFQGHLSIGDVTLYTSAVTTVQGTLLSIVFASTQISEQILYFRQYTDLLAMPQPLPIALSPREVPALADAIELRDVSFRYSEKHPWVLRHVNLCIPAGQCLALVGLNGAGKTTTVKLLARLYDPTEGQVLWDGVDLREFDPLALRRHIAAIFQDFAHYDLTVQENIGLGDAERIEDIAAVRQAAQQSGIDEFIAGLPQGYETVLSRWLGEKLPTVSAQCVWPAPLLSWKIGRSPSMGRTKIY